MKNFDFSTPTRAASKKLIFHQRQPGPRSRSGLAPLEMVLSLPLLMGMMGLVMVFGFVASWKVRSEVVARDVGWRMRNPRSNGLHQRSEEWPELQGSDRELGLSTSTVGGLASVADQDVVQAPIIRGPIPEIDVNNDLLDLSRDVVRGISTVDQPSQVMGEIGRVDYQTQNDFLSEEFKYRPMGIGGFSVRIPSRSRNPRVFLNNFARRLPFLWETDLDVLYDNGGVSSTIFAINALRDPIVLPIDEDMDFYDWPRRFLNSRPEDNTVVQQSFDWEWQPRPTLPDPRSYMFMTDYSLLQEFDFDDSTQRPRRFPSPFEGTTSLPKLDETRQVRKWQHYEEGREKVRQTIVEAYLYEIPAKPLSMVGPTLRLYEKAIRKSMGTADNPDDLNEPRLTGSEKEDLNQWISGLKNYQNVLQEKLEASRTASSIDQ